MPMPPTLYSVAIFVTDIDRAKTFYRDHLGLTLIKEGSFGAEFCEGETRLGVHPAVHPDARAMVGRQTGVTLRVSGLLPYCERLHECGVRFVTEPTRQSFGIMALITDPDGNVFALWDETVPE